MRVEELDFSYPENLVATERAPVSRVMLADFDGDALVQPRELANGLSEIAELFDRGDVLVLNDTKVMSRRVFTESGLEILFLGSVSGDLRTWHVLCPSSRWNNGTKQTLPGGVTLELTIRGRPQTVEASEDLTDTFFDTYGELPLPPYIQKARDERHNRTGDKTAYQTAWAEKPGSLAAPTASLHFSAQDLLRLQAKGVTVARITLHVGLGTFLPVTAETLDEHVMHGEYAEIPAAVWMIIEGAKGNGRHVWALGTTVTRTLESAALGKLEQTDDGSFFGSTDLFIRPGYEFKIVDRLLTNFHQPRSTLIALVSAFAENMSVRAGSVESGVDTVKRCYQWAIERKFRLFSYGDLSVWIK